MREYNEIDSINGLKADKSTIIDIVQNKYNTMVVELG
jgi:hypothetical protein